MIGYRDMYLGAKLRNNTTANGVTCWSVSPSKYAQEACRNCRTYLEENFNGKFVLPKDAVDHFPVDFDPIVDTSTELERMKPHTIPL